MKIHFLGGADEVGASCVLVDTGKHRILVDAGVRMGAKQRDRLPDLALGSQLGGIDEVLVTHAHLDHTGALPLVHGAFPGAGITMTPPTLALLRILLFDALKIMETNAEDEIPLYPKPAVESLLVKSKTAPFCEPVSLCKGAVRATFFPAGHVLGAAAVGLETEGGNVLVTGDVSIADQLTVPGMPRPRFRPDAVVCESTYGARLHASRKAEEERLVEGVFETLRAGGRVLIPAFALGRAQEVLLALREALQRPDAPAATVWMDGMVRSICGAYGRFTEALSVPLRRRAEKGSPLFETPDGKIKQVSSAEQREEIASGPPCVVVSSSGMLSGGPSTFYASRWAEDPAALIAITGYQDEESPGRRLLDIMDGKEGELNIGGRTHMVRCRVGAFGLSAHADADELVGLLTSLSPRQVALVHGDPAARDALSKKLYHAGIEDIALPAAGSALEVAPPKSRRPAAPSRGIGRGRPFDPRALAEIHELFWSKNPAGRLYAPSEIAAAWFGDGASEAEIRQVRETLERPKPFFCADFKRPFLYRCVDPAAGRSDEEPASSGRMEQNTALAEVDAAFPEETGLYKRGLLLEEDAIRLHFRFPDIARRRHEADLAELEERTGWTLLIHPEPHLASVEALAREILEEETTLLKAPSVFVGEKRVKLRVDRLPDDECFAQARQRFHDRTGFSLELEAGRSKTAPAKQRFDDKGRMEINLAYAEIDRAFQDEPHRPTKRGKKSDAEGEHIELSFISPKVAERTVAIQNELEERTGWRIKSAKKVDQQAVLQAVGAMLPESWDLQKNPGLDVPNLVVRLKLSNSPADDELEAFEQNLDEKTGFGVRLV